MVDHRLAAAEEARALETACAQKVLELRGRVAEARSLRPPYRQRRWRPAEECEPLRPSRHRRRRGGLSTLLRTTDVSELDACRQ